MRLLPAACAVLLLLASPDGQARQAPVASKAASASFDELYRRGQEANKGIRTITATFVETTTNALLDRPIVERGRLYVERPSRVALHYTDPPDRRTIIDGKWLTTLWPSRNVRTRMDVGAAQGRAQRYFVGGDAGELRRIFDIELREPSARAGTHEVLMLPKRRQIREGLSRLELWVDEGSGLLRAMRMTFPNGDAKLMEFEGVTPNAPIDPAVFVVPAK
jgi:outer membrane lipoprotein-sorting protein